MINNKTPYQDTFIFENLIQKYQGTVKETRIGVFAPISKITGKSVIAKNFKANGNKRYLSDGTIVKGALLTQEHDDLIKAIFACSIGTNVTHNGSVAVYFHRSRVQEFLGKSVGNSKQFKKLIDDITTASIEFPSNTEKEEDNQFINIISGGGYSTKYKHYVIAFSEFYVKLFEHQILIDYGDHLRDIALIDNSFIKAIVKNILTHHISRSFNLENLIREIGAVENSRNLRKYKNYIIEYKDTLNNYGIFYDSINNTIFYDRSKNNVAHSTLEARKKLNKSKQDV